MVEAEGEKPENKRPIINNNVKTTGIGCGTAILATILLKCCVVDGIEARLDNINSTLAQQSNYKLQEQNILGEDTPERFYEINEQRVYLEIDGKPIEQYFGK